ncbi:1675_t:CDS:1 [Ambispora gerdemannii]|uniref:1675_t:CDS:1 n=1 Tax=Ambispora gerdemannii TaxID=144530 RepID=A0A9N9GPA0_9GLOM|nr:1675_t:CDS:1 [Ambispora gerdemannii]
MTNNTFIYIPSCLPIEYFSKNKRDGKKQKKEPNSFIVFRACFAADIKNRNIEIGDATVISGLTAYNWRLLSKEQKKPYELISSELKKIRQAENLHEVRCQETSNRQEFYQDESYQYLSHQGDLHREQYQNTSNPQEFQQDESYQNLSHQDDLNWKQYQNAYQSLVLHGEKFQDTSNHKEFQQDEYQNLSHQDDLHGEKY